jgi:hypothetical protein
MPSRTAASAADSPACLASRLTRTLWIASTSVPPGPSCSHALVHDDDDLRLRSSWLPALRRWHPRTGAAPRGRWFRRVADRVRLRATLVPPIGSVLPEALTRPAVAWWHEGSSSTDSVATSSSPRFPHRRVEGLAADSPEHVVSTGFRTWGRESTRSPCHQSAPPLPRPHSCCYHTGHYRRSPASHGQCACTQRARQDSRATGD